MINQGKAIDFKPCCKINFCKHYKKKNFRFLYGKNIPKLNQLQKNNKNNLFKNE